MGAVGIHPMFLDEKEEKKGKGEERKSDEGERDEEGGGGEGKGADLLSQIRNFRPPHTILEVKAREKGSERLETFF